MLLEKLDMSHSNQPYRHNAERQQSGHTRAGNLMLGRAVGLQRSGQDTSLYGCPNTPMLKLVEAKGISMNIALLCLNILADRLKAMSLFITRMGLRVIIGWRILSYSPRMFIEGKLSALIVGRSLQ